MNLKSVNVKGVVREGTSHRTEVCHVSQQVAKHRLNPGVIAGSTASCQPKLHPERHLRSLRRYTPLPHSASLSPAEPAGRGQQKNTRPRLGPSLATLRTLHVSPPGREAGAEPRRTHQLDWVRADSQSCLSSVAEIEATV